MIYTRVNGEQLQEYKGRNVCLLGRPHQRSADTNQFELTTSDNKKVLIKLKASIRDQLSDVVEVYGEVDEKGNINAVNYSTFDEHLIQNFDMELYNETLIMMGQLPKFYVQA